MVHSIRLRGPWEYQPLASAAQVADGLRTSQRDLPPGGTLEMPSDWGGVLGRDFRGLVRFTRRFATPTGLDEGSRVWLVVEEIDWRGTAALNGVSLGTMQFSAAPATGDFCDPPCPVRFDITTILQPRNVLAIDILLPANEELHAPLHRPGRENLPGGLIGLVRLEVESS